jgi:hypothetical protein
MNHRNHFNYLPTDKKDNRIQAFLDPEKPARIPGLDDDSAWLHTVVVSGLPSPTRFPRPASVFCRPREEPY